MRSVSAAKPARRFAPRSREFEVTTADGATTLRAELPDQAALHGTLDRIQSLGLKLLELRVVET